MSTQNNPMRRMLIHLENAMVALQCKIELSRAMVRIPILEEIEE